MHLPSTAKGPSEGTPGAGGPVPPGAGEASEEDTGIKVSLPTLKSVGVAMSFFSLYFITLGN